MKPIKTYLVFFFFLTVASLGFAQNGSDFKQKVQQLPAFSMFGDNYFVTGAALNEKITEDSSDAKFQVGFKQRLSNLILPGNTFLFLTYRQKSFWDIYKDSFPFRETNYNPSLGIAKLVFNRDEINYGIWFQFEHESNGQAGVNSRAWNFLSVQYLKCYTDHWQFRFKGWLPVGSKSDNPDILDFRGYFELGASWKVTRGFFLEGDFRKAFTNDLRGSAKLSASLRLSRNSNQFLYLQYFVGHSEDLIDYNRYVNNLRIGIAFKDLFANFRD